MNVTSRYLVEFKGYPYLYYEHEGVIRFIEILNVNILRVSGSSLLLALILPPGSSLKIRGFTKISDPQVL